MKNLKQWVILVYLGMMVITYSVYAQNVLSQMAAQDLIDTNANWGLSYFNFSSTSVQLADEALSSWNIYQHIAFNYRFNWSRRVSLRLPMNTTTPGVYDQRGNVRDFESRLGDVHLVYNQFALAEFPHEWDLNATYYIYLPTSDQAKERRWLARLRAWFTFEHQLNSKTLFSVWFQPEYFLNTQKAFRNETRRVRPDGSEFISVRAQNNVQLKLSSSLVLTHTLSKVFSPQIVFEYEQTWTENSAHIVNANTYFDQIALQLGSWINVSRNFRFLVGYENSVRLTNRFGPPGQPQFFTPENSQYYIMTFFNIF